MQATQQTQRIPETTDALEYIADILFQLDRIINDFGTYYETDETKLLKEIDAKLKKMYCCVFILHNGTKSVPLLSEHLCKAIKGHKFWINGFINYAEMYQYRFDYTIEKFQCIFIVSESQMINFKHKQFPETSTFAKLDKELDSYKEGTTPEWFDASLSCPETPLYSV